MKASNKCNTATDKGLKPCKQIFKTPGKSNAKSKGDTFSSPVRPCPVHSPVMSGKFKLQLFPIDGSIKAILEQHNHNPYLELTLTTQKKMSSVVKHLTEKWSDTLDFSTGEILLFPYNARPYNVIGLKRWSSNDKYITAADVYFMLSSPSIFRLRYGWFSNLESAPYPVENFHLRESPTEINRSPLLALNGGKESQNNAVGTHQINAPNNKPSTSVSLLDSLSNLSFGAILSKATPALEGNNPISQHKNLNSLTSDSFDADFGALIARQQPTNHHAAPPKAANNNNCSIWDAEETCDAFFVQKGKNKIYLQEKANLRAENQVETDNEEKENELMPPKDESNLLAKLDFSWTESMGAFENVVPSSRPTCIGTENTALGGLISSSLDAFQKFLHF